MLFWLQVFLRGVMVMSETENKIRHYRKLRGLTQSQLAEAIGETRQTVYKYETGIVRTVPYHKLEKIASVLECMPSELMGWASQAGSSFCEESAPYLTEEETRLLEAWHRATDKERSVISLILKEYGMPEPKRR